MKWQYKEEHPFEKRRAEGEKIRKKYPDRYEAELVVCYLTDAKDVHAKEVLQCVSLLLKCQGKRAFRICQYL